MGGTAKKIAGTGAGALGGGALLGVPGAVAGGYLGNRFVGDTSEDPAQPGVPQDTAEPPRDMLKEAIDRQAAQGQMSEGDIAARSMTGVGDSQAVPTAQGLMQQSAGLGGNQDAGMAAAIANRQGERFKSHVNDLSQVAGMKAKIQRADQQGAAMAAMAQGEDLKAQMYNTQLIKYQNDIAKKNAVLNTILGLGGTIGGGVAGAFAGSPVAGAQIGGGLASGGGKLFEKQGGNTEVQGVPEGGGGSSKYFRSG